MHFSGATLSLQSACKARLSVNRGSKVFYSGKSLLCHFNLSFSWPGCHIISFFMLMPNPGCVAFHGPHTDEFAGQISRWFCCQTDSPRQHTELCAACCAGLQGIATFLTGPPKDMLVWSNRRCVCRTLKSILHATHLTIVLKATAVSQATRCPLPSRTFTSDIQDFCRQA